MAIPVYDQHPYGKSWKPFDEATFADLVNDIKQRKLDQTIWLYQGMVLDGWNRYQACIKAGKTPTFKEFKGTDLEAAELVHASGIRRHITQEQRAAAFLLLCEACPEFKAKFEQMAEQGKQQQKAGTPLTSPGQRVDTKKAKAKASRVGKSTFTKVEAAGKKGGKKAIEDIAAGKTTAAAVLKIAAEPEEEELGWAPYTSYDELSGEQANFTEGMNRTWFKTLDEAKTAARTKVGKKPQLKWSEWDEGEERYQSIGEVKGFGFTIYKEEKGTATNEEPKPSASVTTKKVVKWDFARTATVTIDLIQPDLFKVVIADESKVSDCTLPLQLADSLFVQYQALRTKNGEPHVDKLPD